MTKVTKQPEDAVLDTKRYIISTARHFFSEYSYLGTSMNDIAKKLHITKAALYYHFAGKADIYRKVLDDVFNDLSLSIAQASNEATTDKRLHKLIKNYLDFGLKEKNLVKASTLKLSPADNQIMEHITDLREKIVNLIEPIVKEASTDKRLTRRVDSRLLTSLLTNLMDGLLLEYSFLDKKINSKRISDQIVSILF